MDPPVSMQAQTLTTYWQLRGLSLNGKAIKIHSILKAAGYGAGNHHSCKTLRDRLHRIDVGLLCYNTCSTDELRKFAKNRGVQKRPEKLDRNKLIASLMRADRKLTFPRFMDLPPELRNNITELYMAEFSTLTTPAQPPLSCVSQQVRNESLSLFYACCSFRVELRTTSVTGRGRFVFPTESSAFLSSIKEDNPAHLTDLTIDLMYMKTNESIGVARILKKADEEYTITWTPNASPYAGHDLIRKLDAMFAKEDKRITGKKLQLGNIWALRVKMENAWEAS